jgi:hypothetical protein
MKRPSRQKHAVLGFEHRHEPLAPLSVLRWRLARSAMTAFVVLGLWLAVGTVLYHWLGGLGWIDSIYNASMIAGGMGPVDPIHSVAAKLFASAYAVLSGALLLVGVSILLTPLFHRVLHEFHVEADE